MIASNLISGAGDPFSASSVETEGVTSLSLKGFCIDDTQRTFETEWFSSHAIAARCPESPQTSECIFVYVDVLGRLAGWASPRAPQGFRLDLNISESDRKKLEELIALIKSRAAAGLPLGREHERIVPAHREVAVADLAGGSRSGRLVDVSRSGAAVEVEGKFEVGDKVRIGERTQATVVRFIDNGVAVRFHSLIPFEEFTERVEL